MEINRKPKLENLTLREKIGQTAVVMQKILFENFSNIDQIKQHLKEQPYGSLWVQVDGKAGLENAFGEIKDAESEKGYVENYPKWIAELNSSLNIPLLIGTDAEVGGKNSFAELTLTTTAAGLGATGSEKLAFETGACVASELRCAGVNWIWVPFGDITNPSMGVCINRGYSDNVELCQKLASAQVKGIQSVKMGATIKHFPGSGMDEYRDPHASQGINEQSLNQWKKEQGSVYKAAIDAGVYSVMMGHYGFPAVDDTKTIGGYMPASVSYHVITKLLKEDMGFDGVVVTDGIGMRSLRLTYDLHKLYVELIKAGIDVVLAPLDLDYIDVIERAVLSGEIPLERINDACQRVLNMKEKLGLFHENHQISEPFTKEKLEMTQKLNKEVAEKSVTLVCNNHHLIPVSKKDIKKVVIIYLGYRDVALKAMDEMKKSFEKRGAEVKIQRFLDEHSTHDNEHSGAPLEKEYDLIVYVPHLPHENSIVFTGEQFRTVVFSLAYGEGKSIVVSVGSPFVYYDYFTASNTYINAYSFTKEVLEATVAGIYGEIPFVGKSPFNLFTKK